MNQHKTFSTVLVFAVIALLLFLQMQGCKQELNLANYQAGEEYSGGTNGTTFDNSQNAFGNKVSGLSTDQEVDFTVGNSFNRNNWVEAPSSTVARDGLGPLYNALSCSGCHKLDGRGEPPLPGMPTVSMVYRLGNGLIDVHGGQTGVPNFGGQLGNYSISGFGNEGDVSITYTEISGTYSDGTSYSLRTPYYSFQHPALASVLFSPRVAPVMIGMGLIDALSEQEILKNADEMDRDGDGISGKPNMVWDKLQGRKVIGKLGWKCNTSQTKLQVAAALVNDIGITSSIEPNEALNGNQIPIYASASSGGSPEISDKLFQQLTFYTSALAVPARRNPKDESILAGKKLFLEIGCARCHIPTLQTASNALLPQLGSQSIHPYSDFLLHDMGQDLADKLHDFSATEREWRTPPLWGLGLIPTVNRHQFLLHDGRARGVEEAILWHGGEGEFSKERFKQLSKTDRERIIKFVNDL